MKKEWVANVATGVLVVCALVVTALIVRRELLASGPETVTSQRDYVQDWADYARSGRVMGPADAAVTLVEFSDFQCPACRALAGSIRTVRERYPDELRVVYRHFPLKSHPHAIAAVRASECAGAQGRFEAFHDALYAEQDSIGELPWLHYARAAGVPDIRSFGQCAASAAPLATLHQDTTAARKLGVKVTPTILVNGVLINGAPPAATLEQIVEKALAERRARR
jgi:protein-disulfide isomerase